MAKTFLETSIQIHAPVTKVWRVFADPMLTRQMGGEYVTDWKVGDPFSFKKTNGEEVTAGVLLKYEPEKLLQHTVRSAIRTTDATLTYEFSEQDGITTLKGREEFEESITDEEHADSLEGWKAALNMVKEIAEKQE